MLLRVDGALGSNFCLKVRSHSGAGRSGEHHSAQKYPGGQDYFQEMETILTWVSSPLLQPRRSHL